MVKIGEHAVVPKAPLIRPIGKSDNCGDEELGRCPRPQVRICLRGDGSAGAFPPAWTARAIRRPPIRANR